MTVLITINLISVLICYFIAKRRKAKVVFWVLVSLILGPLAVPFVFLAKPKDIIQQL